MPHFYSKPFLGKVRFGIWKPLNFRFHRIAAILLILFFSAGIAAAHSLRSTTRITANPAPTISAFSPASGAPGTQVTITGSNFNTTAADNIVYFGATRATVTASTATQLTVRVPAGATFKPITVLDKVTGLAAYSPMPFLITIPPYLGKDFTAASFKPYQVFNNSVVFRGISIADFDGDGKPDIVASQNSKFSVLRNTSTASANSFGPLYDLTLGANSRFAFTGDVDGDGKIDVIAATSFSGLNIFRNTSTAGSIAFATRVDFPANNGLSSVAISDLDGDGKPEIVATNTSGNIISVYKNSGTPGNLTSSSLTRTDFAANASGSGVAIGDLDGDGKKDIVVAHNSGTSLSVFRNTVTNGTIDANSFAPKEDLDLGASGFHYAVSLGDLDGDGKLDIVVPKGSTPAGIAIFRNTSTPGANSFAPRVELPLTATSFYGDLADLDGDGKLDIVAVVGNKAVVFRNKAVSGSISTDSFVASMEYAVSASGSSNAMAIADMNGDGKADIVPTIPSSSIPNSSFSILYNDAVDAAPSIPTDANAAANTVAENAANGTTVGITVASSDPEGGAVSFSLSDDAGGRFAINAATGLVTVADGTLLDYETNTSFDITIQASDGNAATSQTFTIAISDVAETISSNADLAALALSSGTLDPAFAAGTTSYQTFVDNSVTSVSVSPSPAESHATITVNGGSAATPVALVVGPNPVTIVVTAQDGVSQKTYELTITRSAPATADEVEYFEGATNSAKVFTHAATGLSFTLTNAFAIAHGPNYGLDAHTPPAIAGGSDFYIDNFANPAPNQVNAIKTSDGTLFTIKSLYAYPSSQPDGNNPSNDGTITFRGKRKGVVQFTVPKTGIFKNTVNLGTDYNGFTLIDFSEGIDNSKTLIDELEISFDNTYQYLALDNFSFTTTPSVSTQAATSITGTTATLNATVNPRGAALSHIGFEYSTSSTLASGLTHVTATPSTLAASKNNSTASASLTGLTAGTTYYYRVKSENSVGVNAGEIFSFSTQTTFAASISSSTNTSCFGGSNGSATVTASGGTAPFTYSWNTSPAQITATASGLAAGDYTVMVTDANGTQKTVTVSITQPASAVSGTTVVTNVSCNGGSNGAINLTPSGGTGPYTYNWGGGITTQDRTGLAAGDYSATITDANGCTGTVSATVTQPAVLAATTTQTNVSTFGGSNGSAAVTVSGGAPPYSYDWTSTPAGDGTNSVSGLTAGTYTVTITDANSCVISLDFTITQPAAVTVTSINPADPSPANGTAVNYTVTFSVAVSGVDAGDFTLVPGAGITGASVANVTGSGTTYTVAVNTGTGDGDLKLNFTGTTGVSPNVSAAFTSGQAYAIDKTAPGTAISSSPAALSNSSSASFAFSSDDHAASFQVSLDGAGFTPAGNPVSFAGLDQGTHTLHVRAIDLAGNLDATPAAFSWIIDTVKPTVSGITRQNPTEGTTRADALTFRVTFSEKVKNITAADFSVSGTTATASSATEQGSGTGIYDVAVEGGDLAANTGEVSLSFAADQDITDEAGNALTGTTPTGSYEKYLLDNIAPTVTGVANNGIYNANKTITIETGATATLNGNPFTSGSTASDEDEYNLIATDAVGNTTTIAFTIDKTAPAVSGVAHNGLYNDSRTITFHDAAATLNSAAFSSGTTLSTDGAYSLIVTDAAGNSSTLDFRVDKTVPTGTVSISNGAATTTTPTVNLSLAWDDQGGSGVAGMRLSQDNSSWSDWESFAATRSYSLSASDGEKTVYVQLKDQAGNISTAVISDAIILDQNRPTVTLNSTVADSVNAAFQVRVIFNEKITAFAAGDVAVAKGSVTSFTEAVAKKEFILTITPDEAGLVTVKVAAGVAEDVAANTNEASNEIATVYDASAPGITLSSAPVAGDSVKAGFEVSFLFSEPVTGFELTDIRVVNGSVTSFAQAGTDLTTFTAGITPAADGLVVVSVAAGKVKDRADNANTASNAISRIFDATVPGITLTSADVSGDSVRAPFEVTFTLSEPVTDFTVADISVTNGTAGAFSQVSTDLTEYKATITPDAGGLVSVSVAANAVTDRADNANGASNELSRIFDATAPGVVITTPAADPTNAGFTITVTFSEAVKDFNQHDLAVNNATLSDFTRVNASVYTALITPATQGEVSIALSAGVARDGAGNENTAAAELKRIYDSLIPAGYAVVFDQQQVDFDNQQAVSVQVTGAEAGTSYYYSITSDAGGAPLTGTGTAAAAGFQLTNLDVSPLADGELKLSFYQQDVAGNRGADFTATVTKLTRNIVAFTALTDVIVPIRTAYDNVPLPALVEVTYTDHTQQQIPVSWAAGNFNGLAAGAYELTGTFTLAAGTTNLDQVQAKVMVIVAPNKVPTALSLSQNSFSPNLAGTDTNAPQAIGAFATADEDDSQHAYALVSGSGSTDNGLFEVIGGQLFLKSNKGLSGKTSFAIRVRATDPYHNTVEQSFTLSKQAYAKPVAELKIVNTFSPNGDGQNDSWVIPELRFYNNVEVEIYDRTGQRLFRSTNPEMAWDGRNQNGLELKGAVLFVVRINDINLVKTGVVTILRK